MADRAQEKINYWILPQLNSLELLHARYVKHSFARHTHDGFALGVIEQGSLKFSYRGEQLLAGPGCINLVIPGEAHDGSGGDSQGWTYRMFYLPVSILEEACGELTGKSGQVPFFKRGVIEDLEMARFIRGFHGALESEALTVIEQETLLLTMLTNFIQRYSEDGTRRKLLSDQRAVREARDYIEDRYAQGVSLRELAAACHLSPFHLLRSFKQTLGVPPHIYLKQVRVRQAKALLAQGCSLARAAQETGFTDQSHFARQFKEITGVTPGKYSNIVQEVFRQ